MENKLRELLERVMEIGASVWGHFYQYAFTETPYPYSQTGRATNFKFEGMNGLSRTSLPTTSYP